MKTFTQVRDAITETYDAAEEHLDKANAAHQEGRRLFRLPEGLALWLQCLL